MDKLALSEKNEHHKITRPAYAGRVICFMTLSERYTMHILGSPKGRAKEAHTVCAINTVVQKCSPLWLAKPEFIV